MLQNPLDHAMVTKEQWETFSATDHDTWSLLFKRQMKLLENRAAPEVLAGLNELNINALKIPKFSEINAILKQKTGFTLIPVTGFIPEDLFFTLLANRKFPSTCFIRTRAQLDYLQEPDIFHDLFGHIPLLAHPVFADFMQAFGECGLNALQHNALKLAATLYWFTVEFGLINTNKGLRIYGAGITSSKTESIYSLESSTPARVKFHLSRLLKTNYHIDDLQRTYFVIESYEQLFDTVHHINWKEIQNHCALFPNIDQGMMLNAHEHFQAEAL